jgi:hypothetical protein
MGGLLVGVAFVELGLRVAGPAGHAFVLDGATSFFDPALFVADPVFITRLAPDQNATIRSVEGTTKVRTNALGLRGAAIGPKPPGTKRVLALGDSFTLGLQVQEAKTWSAALQTRLNDAGSGPVEVWNAGVSGYGTQQSTLQLRALAKTVQADVAILLFYLGNDLRDNDRFAREKNRPKALPPVQPPPPLPPFVRHSLRHLARISRIASKVIIWWHLKKSATDPGLLEYRDEILPFVDGAHLQRLMPHTVTALHGFADTCAQLDIPCLLALAPPAYAVHTDRLEPTLKVFGLDKAQIDLNAPARLIVQRNPTGLRLVDLSADLRAKRDSLLYLHFDPHWSAAGHAQAAATLTAPVAAILSSAKGVQ